MRTGNRDRGPGTQRRARERRAKECDAGTGRRRGEPLHPRNVVGFVALFVALGGGAYATHTHKMGTKDLKRGAVRTRNLGKQAVGTAKLKRRAVGTGRLNPGAVGTGNLKGRRGDRGQARPRHRRPGAAGPRRS